MRAVPQKAVGLTARWEGCVLVAYPDPATGGIPWTIGYGHINGVKPGDKITQGQALAYLQADLQDAVRKLYTVIKPAIIETELTENQWSALISFVHNLGANAKWTIWKRINAKQFDQVPGEMIQFVKANGQKMQGLVNRRTDEIRVWSLDEPGSVPEALPSGVTRSTPTPPVPSDPVAPAKSATIITGCLSACASVGVAAKTVTDTIMPFQYASPVVGQAVATIATIAAAAAVIVLVLSWLKKREART